MNESKGEALHKPHFRADGVRHVTIRGHRFHLRLADKGHNHLWIDGRQPPLILDRTAADFVAYLIDALWLYQDGDGVKSDQVVEHVVDAMVRKYWRRNRKLTRERVREDLDRIYGTLMAIAQGQCPAELGIEAKAIDYDKWTAPARMDLAVTYRCNLHCGKCYLPGPTEVAELSLDQWLKVYETIWKLGVSQVVFTGGEPTVREDIVELVSHADEFVTGLVTNGTRLVELAEPLKDASLDYAQITVESGDPSVHDAMTEVAGSHGRTVAGLKKALEVGLEVVTNTTLTKANAKDFVATLTWLHEEIGIDHCACNTLICSGKGVEYRREHGLSDEELRPILEAACEYASANGLDLQWYSPTCYNVGINPLELGFGVKSCSAAAHNMTVQPDGTVLPCQSWPDSVGNILTDRWTKIWRNPTCVKLRRRALAPAECGKCGLIGACGGGCPLDPTPRKCSEEVGR